MVKLTKFYTIYIFFVDKLTGRSIMIDVAVAGYGVKKKEDL